jgi:hypothetical protein
VIMNSTHSVSEVHEILGTTHRSQQVRGRAEGHPPSIAVLPVAGQGHPGPSKPPATSWQRSCRR